MLPIPDPLLVELKVAKKRQLSEKLKVGAGYADLGYVVCNEAGQPYHPDTLSKMWVNTVAVAGCPEFGCTMLGIRAVPRCTCKACRPL